MFTIDAHLDLATNALSLNRDLKKSVQEIRNRERSLGMDDTPDRGNGSVALPDLRRGNVGLVVATIISRVAAEGASHSSSKLVGWHSPEQAFAFAQGQLAWYRVMEEQGEMVQITDRQQLENHLQLWQDESILNSQKPVGYILSLEGADSVIDVNYLERYVEEGLRAIGPAHYGPGRYAPGTHGGGGGLTPIGKDLLREMDRHSLILDATHLTDKGFFEAMDIFQGTVWASHQNCRALVPGERQFSDEQLKVLIERGAVMGGALDSWMLCPDYHQRKAEGARSLGIDMEKLVDHFDHICQLAGDANHIAFGTDLDGLFGIEQMPYDMDTIADLAKYESILSRRGYSSEDIEKVFHGNWLRLLRKAWQ
ncbi:dipeptidase [Persicitalea jodogahamensis]|uniref:Peptidase n=1 Tax=Persicitalea jodogahamensis TaxID=402147 RepID=A0A8J3D2X5_9BACT|nr:membrane dipeptidase [Persicitalea jodogahamensis]GHB72899.1 peptidase [Persicitalea jodogahamensis]